MRVIVCGNRTFGTFKSHLLQLDLALSKLSLDAVILHGGAKGADELAGKWAERNERQCVVFSANWEKYDKAAGPIRNAEMLRSGKPDLVIAFWDRRSPGTRDMVTRSKLAGVEVHIYAHLDSFTINDPVIESAHDSVLSFDWFDDES